MRLLTQQLLTALLLFATLLQSQPKPPTTTTLTAVPKLVRVSSSFHPANGPVAAAVESVTLTIYAEEVGGTALWQETQNVSVDSDGHYSVLLGSTRNEGLPLELFASGEQRWLGVQFQRPGEAEQPRVLLASVPYALKAADADTLGGRPASAYVVAEPLNASNESLAATAGVVRAKAAVPRITSGTPNTIAKFVNTMDLGNSVMFENAGKIGLGTVNPLDYFHSTFTNTNGVLTGYAVQNLGNTATSYSGMLFYDQNGALGQFQGFNNSTHEYRINNIAATNAGIFSVYDGSINFMIGSSSKILVRTDGDVDVPGSILKGGTLFLHNVGNQNTGVGLGALALNTGASNTALGPGALQLNTTGSENTASGVGALGFNTTGSSNTAIGANAGVNLSTGNSNIMIANIGNVAESATIRIGDSASQNRAFIAGIRGIATGSNDAIAVLIDSNGQLGTTSSSRRFKEDIHDMGDASSNLLRLRPVTYRYKQPYADGSKPMDYGLIAEEVAEAYPDLVVRGKDGQVETVQYQKLTPMLLNEVQKQQERIVRQEHQNQRQQGEIEELKARLKGMSALEARLAALEALLSSKVAATVTGGQ